MTNVFTSKVEITAVGDIERVV